MESSKKPQKKVNRDQVRIRTNKNLQNTSLGDARWKSVSAPIARHIQSTARDIVEDEGFQSVRFSQDAMNMLIEITQQFITLGASDIQASVEHGLRHTAIDTDVNIARSSFIAQEGLLPAPSQCDVSVRYANHSDRSKAEISRNSSMVKKKFSSLESRKNQTK